MRREATRQGLAQELARARAAGMSIAFVPTMGFLHEGHLTLVDYARRHGDYVVMSIFVNPLQFGPREDLARYPRDLERDALLARERGVELLFHPSEAEMYAAPPAVLVHAPELSQRLCGRFRPGHFEGVLTVVAKLFNLVRPTVAVFGQKDFQQSVLVRRMVADLDFDTRIVIAPTRRESDGLAMSSRNVFLSATERQSALKLSAALRAAAQSFREGERDPNRLLTQPRALLEQDTGIQLQYIEVVNAETLAVPIEVQSGNVVAVAAMVGRTRLIDNLVLGTD